MPYRSPVTARSIVIDLNSRVPLYRQIADGVRSLIARGALEENAELPSVRALGEMLGVNLNTVAKAYRVLADEGVVALEQGRPARVLAPEVTDEPIDAAMRESMRQLIGRMRLRGATEEDVRQLFEDEVSRFYGAGGR
jgi:GntR family transcriptional regulator